MQNIQLIRYAGSKNKFVPVISKSFNKSLNTLVEPFVGSGALFLNTEFENYIINDIDDKLISIFESVKNLSFAEYTKVITFISKKFGDISGSKDAYYDFRNDANSRFFTTVDDVLIYNKTDYSGLFMLQLYNSCINSLARFGPNGFNQSFGYRHQIIDNYTYNAAKEKLQRAELLSMDAFDLLNLEKFMTGHQIFIDPPYFTRPSSSYANVKKDNFVKVIEAFNKFDNIAYTDSYHPIHQTLNCKSKILRKMSSISPNRESKSKDVTHELLMYKNTNEKY